MTPLLEFRNLRKSFARHILLSMDSFSIDEGECIVLSGRNGSGKTTLLKILSGLEKPDRAEVYYRGQQLNWNSARRRLQRDVIYAHQHPYMLDRSVRANVAYGLLRAGMPRDRVRNRVQRALEWADLAHLADRNARLLSGGEKQRVALTRARVLSPRLLLLDEPIANLDRESREHTVGLIRRLESEGVATIVTTHEPEVAALLGSRQRHLCMTGPARYTIVRPFLYEGEEQQKQRSGQVGDDVAIPGPRGEDSGAITKQGAAPDAGLQIEASNHMIKDDITAVILAGGKARRMGGQDKGLIDMDGVPMVAHIIAALQPQVGTLVINANRNLDRYRELGHPVVADIMGDFFGPLVGMASALKTTQTPYLLTVPCDSPLIDRDLAGKLYAAIQAQEAEISVAHDGERMQPVFALLSRELLPSLLAYLRDGGRKIDTWYKLHKLALADFSDCPEMFFNVNTPEEQSEARKRMRTQNG